MKEQVKMAPHLYSLLLSPMESQPAIWRGGDLTQMMTHDKHAPTEVRHHDFY